MSFLRVSAVDPEVLHALIKGQFVNTGFYTHRHTNTPILENKHWLSSLLSWTPFDCKLQQTNII